MKSMEAGIESLYFQIGRLAVRSLRLFQSTNARNEIQTFRLYAAARSVIEEVANLDSASDITRVATTYITQSMFMSGCIIHRLLESEHTQYLDSIEGQRILSTAVRLLRRISVATGDYPARSAMVLDQLCTNFRGYRIAGQLDTGSLHIHSRGLVSIVYDCLWRFEEITKARPSRVTSHGSTGGRYWSFNWQQFRELIIRSKRSWYAY